VAGTSITTGLPYRFYLVSENAVGLSASASDIATYYACQNPATLAAPTVVTTTSTAIGIAWTAPSDDGGCALTGYAILVGDESTAVAGAVTYGEVHASSVNN
jgi:hypothetical protein